MEEQTLRIEKLKFDDEINELVPEMNEDEWNNFLASVEKEGIRQPIDVNKDMTIIDGRHRVKASKELGFTELQARVHDLTRIEMLKFVRDTAVERRNLTKAQILNIVLSTDDLVGDLEARAKENQRKAAEQTNNKKSRLNSKEPKREDLTLESKEPEVKPQNTNAELGKIAGVSKATVQRAKRIKKENPEAYEKVVKGESTWRTEYDKILESNKQDSTSNESIQDEQPTVSKKASKRDRREEINARYDAVSPEDRHITTCETNAINIVSMSDNLLYQLEEIEDLDLTLQFLKSQDKEDIEKVIKVTKALQKIIEKGDFQNV